MRQVFWHFQGLKKVTSGMKWVTEFPNVFRTAFMLITCHQLLLNLLFAGLYTKTLPTNISSFLNRSIVSLITFFVSLSLLKSATICNGYKEKNSLGITIMYYEEYVEKSVVLDRILDRSLILPSWTVYRSSLPEVILGKGVLKIRNKFTGEYHAKVQFQ